MGLKPPDPPNLQVRRLDTSQFTTLQGLSVQANVRASHLRRVALKELTDNALDECDAVGKHGQVEIERLDRNRYSIADQGRGIPGTPDQLADLFSIHRPMISSKFFRRPERGALGNGLRVVTGCCVATGGTIEITTNNQCVLLQPLKTRTVVIEATKVDHPVGT
jgi:DNA topoisomerase VI subunit B